MDQKNTSQEQAAGDNPLLKSAYESLRREIEFGRADTSENIKIFLSIAGISYPIVLTIVYYMFGGKINCSNRLWDTGLINILFLFPALIFVGLVRHISIEVGIRNVATRIMGLEKQFNFSSEQIYNKNKCSVCCSGRCKMEILFWFLLLGISAVPWFVVDDVFDILCVSKKVWT